MTNSRHPRVTAGSCTGQTLGAGESQRERDERTEFAALTDESLVQILEMQLAGEVDVDILECDDGHRVELRVRGSVDACSRVLKAIGESS